LQISRPRRFHSWVNPITPGLFAAAATAPLSVWQREQSIRFSVIRLSCGSERAAFPGDATTPAGSWVIKFEAHRGDNVGNAL